MQEFTRTELTWIIGELDRAAAMHANSLTQPLSTAEYGLHELRMKQFAELGDRLQKVVNGKDKRIKIK